MPTSARTPPDRPADWTEFRRPPPRQRIDRKHDPVYRQIREELEQREAERRDRERQARQAEPEADKDAGVAALAPACVPEPIGHVDTVQPPAADGDPSRPRPNRRRPRPPSYHRTRTVTPTRSRSAGLPTS
jgi:hypothetical protein